MPKIQCIPASVTRFENVPEPTDVMGVLKFLEGVGRTCYKSEERITDDSCMDFIRNIHNRKHWAMLEHYIFCFQIDEEDYDFLHDLMASSEEDSDVAEKMSYIRMSKWNAHGSHIVPTYLLSTSATALNYLLEAMQAADDKVVRTDTNRNPIVRICEKMHSMFPMLFNDPCVDHSIDEVRDPGHCPGRDDILILSRDEVRALPAKLRRIHDFMSFRQITDRGLTHEDVRHRVMSFGHESTRYCNYSKKGYQLIIPCWFSEADKAKLENTEDLREILFSNNTGDITIDAQAYRWLIRCKQAIDGYDELLCNGWTPQQARDVLPHSIKTEICMTARLNEWEHYFNMRVPTSAHPQMREMAIPMLQMATDYDAEIYRSIEDGFADVLGNRRRF